jgi:hypothetical protein
MISCEYRVYKLKPILGLMFGIYPIFLKISTISWVPSLLVEENQESCNKMTDETPA